MALTTTSTMARPRRSLTLTAPAARTLDLSRGLGILAARSQRPILSAGDVSAASPLVNKTVAVKTIRACNWGQWGMTKCDVDDLVSPRAYGPVRDLVGVSGIEYRLQVLESAQRRGVGLVIVFGSDRPRRSERRTAQHWERWPASTVIPMAFASSNGCVVQLPPRQHQDRGDHGIEGAGDDDDDDKDLACA